MLITDAGAADSKYYQAAASNDGYSLNAAIEGSSEEDCVRLIEALSNDSDLSAVVVFLDTLKKFVDVISKHEAKRLYKKLRAITVSGGTVVALGHTNKYRDSDGQLIYEGTGDLKSDVDIMMYLYPTKESDHLVVSTEFEKERARVKPHTFSINEDRIVSLEGEYLNVREVENQRKREEVDMEIVYSIRKLLDAKPLNQGTILSEIRAADIGSQKQVKRIKKAYECRYMYSQSLTQQRTAVFLD